MSSSASAKDCDKAGLNSERLSYLKSVIEDDVKQGRYFGAAIVVARHGVPGLHETIGFSDAEHKNPLSPDAVFSLFSTTKAFTNALVFRAIELGQFALTTKVSEVIPEFSGGMREHITYYHLLTHSSGLPSVWIPKADMYIDVLEEIIEAICENIHSTEKPGVRVDYSPLVHHALMGESVRRTDPKNRSYRRLVEEELLQPLGMKDTAIGVRADLKKRHIFPVFMGNSPTQHLGHSNLGPNGAFAEENAEMPWVGAVSTISDMFRFAEMLRRGGELDGARILSPTLLKRARQNQTGQKPNELHKALALNSGWEPFPACIGLGFSLRGDTYFHTQFGTLTSPETFGNYGHGSSLFWIDPELDMTFVYLSAGVMKPKDNVERFQRISDIAVSAAV